MKKSLLKDIVRDIYRNIGQFISIIIILALGVSFFVGIQITGFYMRDAGNKYYHQANASYLEVTTTLGVDENLSHWLSDTISDANIELLRYADVLVIHDDQQLATRIYQNGQTFNKYSIIEGRDLENPFEIVMDEAAQQLYDLELGDFVSLEDPDDHFELLMYEIVGFIQSPRYLNNQRGYTTISNGTLDSFGYVLPKAFTKSDTYSALSIHYNDIDSTTSYDPETIELLEKKVDELESHQQTIEQQRYDNLTKEPLEEIREAQATLDRESEDVLAELRENEALLEDAQFEFNEGLHDFNEAVKEIYKQIDQQPIIYENPRDTIYNLRLRVNAFQQDTYQEIQDGLLQLEEGFEQLHTTRQELTDNLTRLDQGIQEIETLQETFVTLEGSVNTLQEMRVAQSQLNQGIETIYDQLELIATSLNIVIDRTDDNFDEVLNALPEIDPRNDAVNTLKQQYTQSSAQLDTLNQNISALNQGINGGITQINENLQLNIVLNTDSVANFESLKLELDNLNLDEQHQTLITQRDQVVDGINTIDSSIQELLVTQTTLQQTQVTVESGFKTMNQGIDELDRAATTLRNAKIEIDEGFAQIQDGYQTLETSILEAQEEIDEALAEIEYISYPDTFIQERSDFLLGYQAYYDDSQRIEALGQIFPLFLFLISALVSLATIRRMVEEQVTLMGIYKAIGYTKRDIQSKYIIFSGATLVLGLGLGALLGYTFIPTLIFDAYNIHYNIPTIYLNFYAQYLWVPMVLAFISTVGIAWWNSYKILKRSPAELMRPPAPPAGQRVLLERVTWLWKRLSFLQKVTIRNIFRNKSRFFMSIIGIAGCTGLLMTGFGLHDSILMIPDQQLLNISSKDVQVIYDHEMISEAQLNRRMDTYDIETYAHVMSVNANVDRFETTITVLEDDKTLKTFYNLESRKEETLDLPDQGILLSMKVAEILGLAEGDTVSLTSSNPAFNTEVEVSGIFTYYIEHEVIMSREVAQSIGIQFNNNALIIKDSDVEVSKLSTSLLSMEGVLSVIDFAEILESSHESMDSFYIVIVVVILAAASLAFVVLYNLSSMNITERERELATLKVLGFYPKETQKYIFRESVILTLIGVGLGILFGLWLHQFVVLSAEMDNFAFVRNLSTRSIVIACAATLLFSYINERFMRRKIHQIDMLSALKSIE